VEIACLRLVLDLLRSRLAAVRRGLAVRRLAIVVRRSVFAIKSIHIDVFRSRLVVRGLGSMTCRMTAMALRPRHSPKQGGSGWWAANRVPLPRARAGLEACQLCAPRTLSVLACPSIAGAGLEPATPAL